MSAMYELRASTSSGIFAVPFRAGRPGKAARLPDGAIVEEPLDDQRRELSDRLPPNFEVAKGLVPATIHHANLGLIAAFLPLSGVYFLPGGDVAAVYGAEVVAIAASGAPTA